MHSGRMRQLGTGVATIQILIDDIVVADLDNPHPSLPSWQWVDLQLEKTGMNLTVVMMLKNPNSLSATTTAYFDDLCVAFDDPVDLGGRGMLLLITTALYYCFRHNFVCVSYTIAWSI